MLDNGSNDFQDYIMQGVYRSNRLRLITQDGGSCGADGPHTLNHYMDISVPDYTVQIDRQFGCSDDYGDPAAPWEYGWPAFEVNANNDVAFISMRTNPYNYPQLRVWEWPATARDIDWSRLGHLGLAQDGIAPPSPINYFDTAGASVDPFDGTGIWLAQAYPVLGGNSFWAAKMYGVRHGDYVVKSFSRTSPAIGPAGPVAISVTLRNQGDGVAPATTAELVVSNNSDIVNSGSPCGSIDVAALPAGQQATYTGTCFLSSGTTPGSYHLGVRVQPQSSDVHLSSTEYSVTNNYNTSPVLRIVTAAGPASCAVGPAIGGNARSLAALGSLVGLAIGLGRRRSRRRA
jgi:hypothetical protein